MACLDGRIERLTVIARGREGLGDREESWLAYLGQSSLLAILTEAAEAKAERRWLHEHDRVAGQLMDGGGWYMTTGDGWVWHTNEAEREALTRRELADLQELVLPHGAHGAIRAWITEPDTNGWPIFSPRPGPNLMTPTSDSVTAWPLIVTCCASIEPLTTRWFANGGERIPNGIPTWALTTSIVGSCEDDAPNETT
jgi:hypothetical protein